MTCCKDVLPCLLRSYCSNTILLLLPAISTAYHFRVKVLCLSKFFPCKVPKAFSLIFLTVAKWQWKVLSLRIKGEIFCRIFLVISFWGKDQMAELLKKNKKKGKIKNPQRIIKWRERREEWTQKEKKKEKNTYNLYQSILM